MNRRLWLPLLALLTVSACRSVSVPSTTEEVPFIERQRLYAPGDYGSANWRIPALLCLDDGTLLAVNDKRKYNESDLPEDIDIVYRRSTDLGKTWSEPQTMIAGQGRGLGYGDPALVQCANGEVLCLFAGHNGYFQSTVAKPISVFLIHSSDRGRSWSDTVNLTSVLWDATSGYHGAFVASGNGLRLKHGRHAGRVLFAASLLRDGQYVSDNYVLYSDDNGRSWHRSQLAFSGGDESKLMELSDGRLLISVRRSGARGYNLSEDGGESWGEQGLWEEMATNACNGDMLRVNDTLILHSIPNSMQRERVSIFSSSDEGRSWHSPVSLFEGPSVYSSLTLLPDGTIGAFIEQNPSVACELWYYRFNLAWLRSQR
ncbi:MAG: exo-alpha-sialidase [Bacteroidales bacterium]|nr:exo-alpha-sialidase [Bacteroidales bacterium]